MKKYLVLASLLFIAVPSFALHIAGGELYYSYIGPGTDPGTDKYSITLRLFRECNPVTPNGQQAAPMPESVELGVFTNVGLAGILFHNLYINRTQYDIITLQSPLVCIVNPPSICYQIGYFTAMVDLPRTADGYTIAYQTCCRSFSILNVQFFDIPHQAPGEGATYTCTIPGTNTLGNEFNSSAVFDVKDTVLVCQQKSVRLDFSATDPDTKNPKYKDSLSYSFCSAFNRGNATGSGDIQPSNPPYTSVTYTNGYSGESPLGPDVKIDPKTGIITGKIGFAGGYVVNVCVTEWRHGTPISVHRKDFLLRVAACDFAAADLAPSYITCDGFGLNFKNESTSSAIKSYFWDFGVNGTTSDTSTSPTPFFTYSDTGTYPVKLIINKGQECTDSGTTLAEVYPGFVANFDIAGNCVQTPYQFFDKSVTKYGSVNSWFWTFGDGDTSSLTNPSHKYAAAALTSVGLTVTNTKGCTESVTKTTDIRERPYITLPFRDTLICRRDTLQLQASTTVVSKFTWSPNSHIDDTTVQNPFVYPTRTTTYSLFVDDGNGCNNTDSILVNVTDSAFVTLGNDTTICLGDTVILRPNTNALYFAWQPAASLDNASAEYPHASPRVSTDYSVVASISPRCVASAGITIQEIPYPQANAGPDVSICYGKSVQLSASIKGSDFTWSPAASLFKANTLTPIAGPQDTTTYILTVYDTVYTPNCPKPGIDSVTVRVIPPVNAFAGNDTSVVINQPLQLNATGGISYTWDPPTSLNKANIPNPVAVYYGAPDTITYTVKVQTADNCVGYADVTVHVFETHPEIFVPSAFTPNGDGENDILRPIVVGIKRLVFFRIYNRYGNLLFTSSNQSQGWDGTYKGTKQQSGTYVYVAQGVDYSDHPITRKGNVVLIR